MAYISALREQHRVIAEAPRFRQAQSRTPAFHGVAIESGAVDAGRGREMGEEVLQITPRLKAVTTAL